MSQPFVSLKGIEKRFAGHHAVRGLDLDIASGEFIAIMGPSGCGKSTTLRMIAGLDEPLSALDAHLRVRMQTELARLHRELRITFVYVTHAQSEAFALADRMVIMADGRVQQAGRPQDVYRAPANAFVANFIGTNNLGHGEVRASAAGTLEVAGAVGTFAVPTPAPRTVGSRASFVIAADRVSLGAPTEAPAGLAQVQGTVLGLEFVGSTQTVFVEVPGSDSEFRVQKQQHEIDSLGLTPGQQVHLSWDPRHAWLLPEAA